MNIAKVLHNEAMELTDEALLAQMEGNPKAALTFYQKAFWLEKEAAIDYGAEIVDELIRYMYCRSAAFLAFKAGYINEAEQLVKTTFLFTKNLPLPNTFSKLQYTLLPPPKYLRFRNQIYWLQFHNHTIVSSPKPYSTFSHI